MVPPLVEMLTFDEEDTLAFKELGKLASHTLMHPSMEVHSDIHP
jgi:hypothetical protein